MHLTTSWPFQTSQTSFEVEDMSSASETARFSLALPTAALEPRRPTDSNGSDNGSNDTQRSHGEDDIVGPAHRLAHELHGDSLAEECEQAIS